MTWSKRILMGGVAAIALTAAGTANAFDKVDWEWNATVTDRITKRIQIDVQFDPTGMVHVEIPQFFLGDVTSTAIMQDVHNIPHVSHEDRTFDFTATGQVNDPSVSGRTRGSLDVSGTAEGFIDIDENDNSPNTSVDLVGIAGQPAGTSNTEGGVSGATGGEDPLTVAGETSGRLGVVGQLNDPSVTVSGSITVPVVVPLNAIRELPKMENFATSIANNASVNTDTMVEAHSGQFVYGDGAGESSGGVGAVGAIYGHLEHEGVNTHQSTTTALNAAVLLGLIEPANIEATAVARNISNAQVENGATAIANNMNFNIDAQARGDAVLIGDLTQFAYADVSSTARMRNVSVSNYSNLGRLDGALFSNVATSIGNNLSITVKGPALNGTPNVPGGGSGDL